MTYSREFINDIRTDWNGAGNVTTAELGAKYRLSTLTVRRIIQNTMVRHYDPNYVPRPIPKINYHKEEIIQLYEGGMGMRDICKLITEKYGKLLSYNTCYVMITRYERKKKKDAAI